MDHEVAEQMKDFNFLLRSVCQYYCVQQATKVQHIFGTALHTHSEQVTMQRH